MKNAWSFALSTVQYQLGAQLVELNVCMPGVRKNALMYALYLGASDCMPHVCPPTAIQHLNISLVCSLTIIKSSQQAQTLVPIQVCAVQGWPDRIHHCCAEFAFREWACLLINQYHNAKCFTTATHLYILH